MSELSPIPYRTNVCMILFNKDRSILVAERHRQSHIWQFPQGGVEEEFSLEENVLRELQEELALGRDDVVIRKQLAATHTYKWDRIPPDFEGKFIGQQQSFWLVEVLNPEAINVQVPNPEFQSVRWVPVENVLAVVEPIRIKGYQEPLKEVAEYFKSL